MAETDKKTGFAKKAAILISLLLAGILLIYYLAFKGAAVLYVYFSTVFIVFYFLAFLYTLNSKFFYSAFTLILTSIFIFLLVVLLKSSEQESSASTHNILTIPYSKWTPVPKNTDKIGVTMYNREKAYPGINIYNSRNSSKAFLMDMSGNILHIWSKKLGQSYYWHHVELSPNGDLLIIVKDKNTLMRLDWDSNILWKKRMNCHHDIAIAGNGDLFVLTNKDDVVFNRRT